MTAEEYATAAIAGAAVRPSEDAWTYKDWHRQITRQIKAAVAEEGALVKVYVLMAGTGEDGDERYILGVYKTPELAEEVKSRYSPEHRFGMEVQPWHVKEVAPPRDDRVPKGSL